MKQLIKTVNGYKIMNVTEAHTNIAYKVTAVRIELYHSDQARDEAFREADLVACEISDLGSFPSQADQNSLVVQVAEDVQKKVLDAKQGILDNQITIG